MGGKEAKRVEYRVQAGSDILLVHLQTIAVKRIPQCSKPRKFFGFPMSIKVMSTLDGSLLSIQ